MVPFTFDIVQVCFHCLLRRHPGPGGGGEVLPEKFGGGVQPASQNPYPIYD